ncbi:hypothetical protein BsWGS_25325 [Bradybaena similaris]
MGNSLSPSSKFGRHNRSCSKVEFYKKVKYSQGGDELLSCSFGSWCREQRLICGFSDKADYTSNRQSLLQFNGSPNKPDTTEGRFFRSGFRSRNELVIHEKEASRYVTVKLPRVSSAEMSAYLRNNRPRRKRRSIRSTRVVAYHDSLVVVQVSSDRHAPFAKFYIINLDTHTCSGNFIVCNNLRRWYEVYMSPNSTHIVLRPDVRYHFQAAVSYHIQNVKSCLPKSEVCVKKIPSFLVHHSITFNSQLGDEHVISAGYRHIQVYKLEDWSVTSQHNLMIQHASIQQIRSSPSGDYLAIRYMFAATGCQYNKILVLHYPQFTKVLQVDVRGAYWPVSELVNMQVFPRFSLSESCFAVMKQHNYGRRVFVYKLPNELRSLQDMCRKAILHLVTSKEIPNLPLPATVKKYLIQHAV